MRPLPDRSHAVAAAVVAAVAAAVSAAARMMAAAMRAGAVVQRTCSRLAAAALTLRVLSQSPPIRHRLLLLVPLVLAPLLVLAALLLWKLLQWLHPCPKHPVAERAAVLQQEPRRALFAERPRRYRRLLLLLGLRLLRRLCNSCCRLR